MTLSQLAGEPDAPRLLLPAAATITTPESGVLADDAVLSAMVAAGIPLGVSVSGNSVVCTWPAANSAYSVQALTNLSGNWTTLGSGVSQNGQSSLTNSVDSNVKFFRLVQHR